MTELFGKVASSWFGKVADEIHKNTFAHWPWGTRLAIAIFWDFCVDTPTRLIAGMLTGFFPGIMAAVRFPLDVVLAVFGTALWGAHGLLQGLEMGAALIPGVGWIVDLLPMLTIAGFLARRREEEQDVVEHTYIAPHKGDPMGWITALLTGVGGLFLGLILWWTGWIDFMSIFWFALAPAAASFVFRLVAWLKVPRIVYQIGGGILAGLLIIDVLALVFWPGLESYRMQAWKSLQEESFFALEVKAAKAADALGKKIRLGDLLKKDGSIVESARSKIADTLEGGGVKSEEVPEILAGSGGERSDTSYATDVMRWLGKKIRPSEPQREAPQKAPAPVATDRTAAEKQAQELGYGPLQTRLYTSDIVLARAREMRESRTSWLWTGFWVFGGLLVLVGLFGFLQNREATRERIVPDVPF